MLVPTAPVPLLRRVSLLGLHLHDFSLKALTFETLVGNNRQSSYVFSHSSAVA